MFDFFKKSFIGAGMLQGFTDVHCHILPGVDDGVQTMKSALRTLNFYEQNGVKRVFFTPHVAEELHENSADRLRERFEERPSQELPGWGARYGHRGGRDR